MRWKEKKKSVLQKDMQTNWPPPVSWAAILSTLFITAALVAVHQWFSVCVWVYVYVCVLGGRGGSCKLPVVRGDDVGD